MKVVMLMMVMMMMVMNELLLQGGGRYMSFGLTVEVITLSSRMSKSGGPQSSKCFLSHRK